MAVAGAAGMAVLAPPHRSAGAGTAREYRLTAGVGRVPLVGAPVPATGVWAYDGTVPGPGIRVRQGERLRVLVENRLAEGTTVHWHGLRVPNAMDGVPDLTQPSIAPGGTFAYEFDVPDAGTYWYHPHQRSHEQVGRGLYGPLVVEERAPIEVDRDVSWVLGDWRLLPDAAISDDFASPMDTAMAGRIGNTVTVNGRVVDAFPVRAGERLRLRLVNAATARVFALEFRGHRPRVVALDGQPVEPHEPEGGRVLLGPGQRADVVLDAVGRPGERHPIADTFYRGLEYRLLDLAYDAEPLRDRPSDAPLTLAANDLPEPDLTFAERHELTLGGGMMGGDGAMAMGGMGGAMGDGMAWTVNGVAAGGHDLAPALELRRGRPYLLALANETAWWHPIHLHGHVFRVVARDGRPTRFREWRDTVMLAPRERADIAFVADNPGDWMIHCHVLLHQEGGMMAVLRVA